MRILVTAFEPFGGERVNAALEAVRLLPDELDGARLERVILPTAFGASVEAAAAAIERLGPHLVVGVGQASGRAEISVERVALNLDDARIPDNLGAQPIDEPTVAGGPVARLATVPVKAMVEAIRAEGIAAELSHTAGTFVCNHLMYGVLHHLATTGREGVRAGFIHVPATPEQAQSLEEAPAQAPGGEAVRAAPPTMPSATTARALVAALSAAARHQVDVRSPLGAIS